MNWPKHPDFGHPVADTTFCIGNLPKTNFFFCSIRPLVAKSIAMTCHPLRDLGLSPRQI